MMRFEIMQNFIEAVRNFELKRNLALIQAEEQYVEAQPTVEDLRFTVQQFLRMSGSSGSENYPVPSHNNNSQHPLTNEITLWPKAASNAQQRHIAIRR